MTGLAYFNWYPGDFRRRTRHLSIYQRGVYRELIDFYMENAGLPDDDRMLARILGITVGQWMQIRPVIVAFFHDGWRHKRCDEELAKAAARSAKASLGGIGKTIAARSAKASRAVAMGSGGGRGSHRSDRALFTIVSGAEHKKMCGQNGLSDQRSGREIPQQNQWPTSACSTAQAGSKQAASTANHERKIETFLPAQSLEPARGTEPEPGRTAEPEPAAPSAPQAAPAAPPDPVAEPQLEEAATAEPEPVAEPSEAEPQSEFGHLIPSAATMRQLAAMAARRLQREAAAREAAAQKAQRLGNGQSAVALVIMDNSQVSAPLQASDRQEGQMNGVHAIA